MLGCFFEQRGYRAATVPSYTPVEMTSETKGFMGAVSLRHVAQAAGLGVLGKNNLLLTPHLGPRVRLGAVVTTADLNPDDWKTPIYCFPEPPYLIYQIRDLEFKHYVPIGRASLHTQLCQRGVKNYSILILFRLCVE